jgi:hypothetical protein
MSQKTNDSNPEPFINMGEAAKRLGLPVYKIRRAVKAGIVKSYQFANSRVYVRLSEVIATIEASAKGGAR